MITTEQKTDGKWYGSVTDGGTRIERGPCNTQAEAKAGMVEDAARIARRDGADYTKIDTKLLRQMHAAWQRYATYFKCAATQEAADRAWSVLVARNATY